MYTRADAKYFLLLVRCALRGEVPSEMPENVSLSNVLELARAHNLFEMLAYSVPQITPAPGAELLAKLKKLKSTGIAQLIHQDIELDALKACFEKNGIDFLVLKGGVLRPLYPSPDMRSMCDLDILVRSEQLNRASELMLGELGYKADGVVEGEHDIGFSKPPFINIELHHSITDKHGNREAYEYYKDIWSLARKRVGGVCEFELSREDFYIHHIEHLAKHYRYGGCGVRAFCDIYIFLEKFGDTLDGDYIEKILTKIRLKDFEEHARALAMKWFGAGEGEEISEKIEEYVLHGGSYGLAEDKQLATVARLHTKNGRVNRFGYFFKKIFLPYRSMTVGYPVLKKAPVLLPFCWIHRIFNRLLFRRDRVRAQLEVTADDAQVLAFLEHMSEVGLN